jgi:hypothetical protein
MIRGIEPLIQLETKNRGLSYAFRVWQRYGSDLPEMRPRAMRDQHEWATLQTDWAVTPPTDEETASHRGMQAAATASAVAAKKQRERRVSR